MDEDYLDVHGVFSDGIEGLIIRSFEILSTVIWIYFVEVQITVEIVMNNFDAKVIGIKVQVNFLRHL